MKTTSAVDVTAVARSIAGRRTCCRDRQEDCIQEARLKVLLLLAKNPDAYPGAIIKTIRNAIVDELRRSRPRFATLADWTRCPFEDPGFKVIEDQAEIETFTDQLTAIEKTTVYAFAEHFNHIDAGAALGISRKACSSRIDRIREKMRQEAA